MKTFGKGAIGDGHHGRAVTLRRHSISLTLSGAGPISPWCDHDNRSCKLDIGRCEGETCRCEGDTCRCEARCPSVQARQRSVRGETCRCKDDTCRCEARCPWVPDNGRCEAERVGASGGRPPRHLSVRGRHLPVQVATLVGASADTCRCESQCRRCKPDNGRCEAEFVGASGDADLDICGAIADLPVRGAMPVGARRDARRCKPTNGRCEAKRVGASGDICVQVATLVGASADTCRCESQCPSVQASQRSVRGGTCWGEWRRRPRHLRCEGGPAGARRDARRCEAKRVGASGDICWCKSRRSSVRVPIPVGASRNAHRCKPANGRCEAKRVGASGGRPPRHLSVQVATLVGARRDARRFEARCPSVEGRQRRCEAERVGASGDAHLDICRCEGDTCRCKSRRLSVRVPIPVGASRDAVGASQTTVGARRNVLGRVATPT